MEVDKRHILDNEVFTYFSTGNGKVFIHWYGKQIKILSGDQARQFVDKISRLEHKDAQLLMAKLTGNFKRGNER